MKNLALSLICLVSLSACMKRIDAGHTGILFNHYGVTDKKGISDREVVSGAVWYNPFVRSVYEYPHFWQTVTYYDVSFNSLEGEPITTTLSVVYRLAQDYIPKTFDEYREHPEELERGLIQTFAMEELNTQAGKLGAVDIMGKKRDELLRNVTSALNEKRSPNFEFQLVSFDDKLDPSPNVKQAIQGVIEAQEAAKKAQARTSEIKEQAQQKLIQARADSAATMISATAEAQRIDLIQSQIAKSPVFIEYIKAQQWDGKLPQVQGDIQPFMQIN